MAAYGVTLRRETSENIWIAIEAESLEEAKKIALERSFEEDWSWQISDTDTEAEIDGEEEDS